MPFYFDRLSILIVEETEPMRNLIYSVLQTLGVGTIYYADNAEQAYSLFIKYNPDIILTDWHMSKGNGLELVRLIRRDAMSPNRFVPVIMMTGYSSYHRVSAARDLGVTEFVLKPFTAEDLTKRLSHVITKPRDFVESQAYFGPDRRRRNADNYTGDERRREHKRSE